MKKWQSSDGIPFKTVVIFQQSETIWNKHQLHVRWGFLNPWMHLVLDLCNSCTWRPGRAYSKEDGADCSCIASYKSEDVDGHGKVHLMICLVLLWARFEIVQFCFLGLSSLCLFNVFRRVERFSFEAAILQNIASLKCENPAMPHLNCWKSTKPTFSFCMIMVSITSAAMMLYLTWALCGFMSVPWCISSISSAGCYLTICAFRSAK